MRKIGSVTVFRFISLFLFIISSLPYSTVEIYAQSPIRLECGQAVESVIAEDRQIQKYVVNAQKGMILVLYADAKIGNYENLNLDIGMWAPNNFEINGLSLSWAGQTSVVETGSLSLSGDYSISVIGGTSTGGAYVFSVSCIESNGNVLSETNVVQKVQCGSIVTNTIKRDREVHRYYIYLEENDRLQAAASALIGNYEKLTLDIGMWAPNNFEINGLSLSWAGQTATVDTAELSINGIYRLQVIGGTSTTGDYDLSIACVLADGTVVNPGDAPPVAVNNDTTNGSNTSTLPEFSGVGFPGLAPIDFSDVAELPLIVGVPMTGAVSPTGGEILGFKFSANEGDVFDLTYTRASGNLNLGLVVLGGNSDVLFQTSLVLSETVSTRLAIPATGEYTVGVFKIELMPPDNPEPTAFQVKVDLNP